MERSLIICAVIINMGMVILSAPQQKFVQKPESDGSFVQGPYKDNERKNGTGELFGYPEVPPQVESRQNARNRTPIYIPNRCQPNELLYPGDQESDWVCDCKATYVFHPPTKQCYQLFTQGYCQDGHMLHLKLGAKRPECIVNDCYQPGTLRVRYEGQCVTLNQYEEVCRHHGIQQIVGVNEESNELGCINISDVKGQSPLPPARDNATAEEKSFANGQMREKRRGDSAE